MDEMLARGPKDSGIEIRGEGASGDRESTGAALSTHERNGQTDETGG